MSIRHAILGLLSLQPCSGYDLKKTFADSAIFYWSGNNQQVYRTLIQLEDEGLVEHTLHPQESLPAKKVYTITAAGMDELNAWLRADPALPELHSLFLIQLSFAGRLPPADLEALIERYEKEVRIQLLMEEEKKRRIVHPQGVTPRQKVLTEMVAENIIHYYRAELNWIKQLRDEIQEVR